ncbi:hypothetical protein [Rhodoligotrophos defluvii]|uniref:hypothetical protein n=1 Tax=Rhodoligotrophos defluvii TaxID=2561934 RepID=UPI0014858BB3|nr:hypothetical protein [Rhodoligotrophos defluvii]
MANTQWTKTLLASTVALGLFAAPAAAVEDFSAWDTNDDAGLNNEEFATGFGDVGVFDDWDTNNDDMLSQSEFDAGYGELDTAEANFNGTVDYDAWDANDDDLLSENEFYDGVYTNYDDDGDNIIEEPEFADIGDDIGDGGFWDV